jgi:hypothetical protein
MSDYICTLCGETFNEGASEEDAIKEYNAKFPEAVLVNKVIVCDDCFNCCDPDLDKNKLFEWRLNMDKLPPNTPVMTKHIITPFLRRGKLLRISSGLAIVNINGVTIEIGRGLVFPLTED